MSGTAAMINPLDAFNTPLETPSPAPGFELLIFATNWGFNGSWMTFVHASRKMDMMALRRGTQPRKKPEGISGSFPEISIKVWVLFGAGETDYQKHLQQFKSTLEAAASLKPVYINCHSERITFRLTKTKPLLILRPS
jgi:hypothetical protein